MPLSAGDRLGAYQILAPVGAGGMGVVYKASDTRLDRVVAIKVSQGKFSERFKREARAAAALNHPNVCQLYDVGPDYLVMEFVDGSAIAPVDNPRKLLDLAMQIADGLAAAHSAGLIHRDLKPDNIGIERNTSGEGAQWQLYSVEVKTGADKFLGPVELPASTDAVAGFSLHPDGNRFLTSIAKWPFDIWMMEGLDEHKSWLDRLLQR